MTTPNNGPASKGPTKLADLYEIAKKNRKKRLVVAVAHDEHSLEAVCAVVKMGLVDATLVGSSEKIKAIAAKLKLDLAGFSIVNEENDAAAVKLAVKMVHDKQGDILMKGNVPTAVLLRGVLDKENGLRKSEVLSHFALFEVPTYHKLLGLTDGAMVIAPDLKTKIAIINNAVEFMNKLGIAKPKVAILGAVEVVNESMPATMEAAVISKMNQRGQIVPDIEAGNILYKAFGFSANARLAANILGAAAPIVLTSRSDTEEAKQASIVMAACIN
jgi:phosphate butyryltransferase